MSSSSKSSVSRQFCLICSSLIGNFPLNATVQSSGESSENSGTWAQADSPHLVQKSAVSLQEQFTLSVFSLLDGFLCWWY